VGEGDDDAVAGEREHRLAVDLDAQPRRAESRHPRDDDVVERDHAARRLRLQRGHERGALVDLRLAAGDPSECGRKVVAAAVGEEPHVAEVDPENRRVVRHRELERAQDGPVAAQRNHELPVRRQAAGLGARAEVDDFDADVPGPRLDEE